MIIQGEGAVVTSSTLEVLRVRHRVTTLATRTPPTEIQLWNAGENPTDYGVHVWNERSNREVLARYTERGNPILIDVEHNGGAMKDGEPAVTGGYARLEVRSGTPWLVFEWSDYGRQQIESGQRRFLSPEYDVDKNTGEILALYRVSLVADPGTHRARMLATAREAPMPEMSVILAALRAALAAEDPAVAKESISNLLTELEKGSGETPTETPAETPSSDVTAETSDDKPSDDEDKDKMQAGAKKPAPAVPSVDTQTITAAGAAAVAQIKAAQRNHLIATQGDRLEPSIRRWASTQPLEVVEGLLAATPAKDVAKDRARATRGAGASGGGGELSERERAMCAEKKIDPAKYAETRAAIKARSNANGTGV